MAKISHPPCSWPTEYRHETVGFVLRLSAKSKMDERLVRGFTGEDSMHVKVPPRYR